MNPVKFCDKNCLEITLSSIKNDILKILPEINSNNNYFLLLTLYNNKKYSLFINTLDKKIIYVRFRFKSHLFTNTLFNGRLVKNTFYINDILLYKNAEPELESKTQIIENIMKNEYIYDNILNVCQIYFNKLTNQNTPSTSKKSYTQHNTSHNNIHNDDIKEDNKNVLKIDKTKSQMFEFHKTELPDVYLLIKDGIEYGIPMIQSIKTSKYIKKLFKEKKTDMVKKMCVYSKNHKKWIPIIK